MTCRSVKSAGLFCFLGVCVVGCAYLREWVRCLQSAVDETITSKECQNCRKADWNLLQGTEHQKAGQFSEAVFFYDKAEASGADLLTVLGEKSYCHYELGMDSQAVAEADRMLEVDRGNTRARLIRGLVYKRAGMKEKARDEFRLALMGGDRIAAMQLRTLESP